MNYINQINSELIPALLTQPRFRIWRHIILLATVAFITTKLSTLQTPTSTTILYLEWSTLFIMFGIIIYLNLYILVPKWLLKNKYSTYLINLTLLLVCSLLIIGVTTLQLNWTGVNTKVSIASLFIRIINIALAIGFLLTCSSTFIIFRNWVINNQRIADLTTATLETELQLLKNQINPHFLFNMLNNANIMVKEDPAIASELLTQLEELLHYQTKDSTKEMVLLNDEVEFLDRYLKLEKSRRDRFQYNLTVHSDKRKVMIPPLLFIPFVENAVKHSYNSKNITHIDINFTIKENKLQFTCVNSKSDIPINEKEGGIGLSNIKRRLDLLYNTNYSLSKEDEKSTYTIKLKLKL